MNPAQQRLVAADLRRAAVDLGLIEQPQLPAGQCFSQIGFDLETFTRLGVHFRRKEPVRRSARRLGVVHRVIGIGQQRRLVLAVFGEQTHADARRQSDPVPIDLDRLGDRAGYPGHDAHDALDAASVRQHDDELVPAQARNRIAGSHVAHQPPRHLDQDAVAGCVPERIVDVLEVVQVHEQHGEPPVGALRMGDRVRFVECR